MTSNEKLLREGFNKIGDYFVHYQSEDLFYQLRNSVFKIEIYQSSYGYNSEGDIHLTHNIIPISYIHEIKNYFNKLGLTDNIEIEL